MWFFFKPITTIFNIIKQNTKIIIVLIWIYLLFSLLEYFYIYLIEYVFTYLLEYNHGFIKFDKTILSFANDKVGKIIQNIEESENQKNISTDTENTCGWCISIFFIYILLFKIVVSADFDFSDDDY